MSEELEPADHDVNPEVFVGEYANIYRYLSQFQVELAHPRQLASRPLLASDAPSITVFKKKNLSKLANNPANIYEHNLTLPDIDQNDRTKLKVSCMRCRKYKKKCLRRFPECLNCTLSDELCIYMPRKTKRRQAPVVADDATTAPPRAPTPAAAATDAADATTDSGTTTDSSGAAATAAAKKKRHNLDMLLNWLPWVCVLHRFCNYRRNYFSRDAAAFC